MVEIDGVAIGRAGFVDQLDGPLVIEIEAVLQHRMQLVALGRRGFAVDRADVDQQRRRGEPVVAVLKMVLRFGAAGEVG